MDIKSSFLVPLNLLNNALTRAVSSLGLSGFVKYSSAPMLNPLILSFKVTFAVNIKIYTSDIFLSILHTSSPSISGSIKSNITSLILFFLNNSMPSSPF
ncbi:hypothetical protein CNEONATNEC32_02090 [Clostridium neonatale]|nr:hypothetical protein CNEONATNEC32_02090 [Clostridium neonatale]